MKTEHYSNDFNEEKVHANIDSEVRTQLSENKMMKKDAINLFKDCKITCSQFNPSFEYCSEQKCHGKGVVCVQQTCQCHKQHKKCCEFMRVEGLHQKINSKVITNTQQLISQVEKQIDSITDMVSLLKEQLEIQLKIFGLNLSQESLLKSIKNCFEQSQNINKNIFDKGIYGSLVHKYRESTKKDQENWFKQSLQKYKSIVRKTKDSIQPFFNQIQNILTYYHAINNPQKQTFRYFNDSDIIGDQSPKFKKILSQHFKEVNSIRKIYNFNQIYGEKVQANKLMSQLNGKQNILILVKNQHNKRFGVFNTSKFDLKNFIQRQADKTILFSLDENITETLTDRGFELKTGINTIELLIGRYTNFDDKGRNGFKLLIDKQSISVMSQIAMHSKNSETFEAVYQKINGQNQNYFGFKKGLHVKGLQIYYIIQNEKIQMKQSNPLMKEINQQNKTQSKHSSFMFNNPFTAITSNIFATHKDQRQIVSKKPRKTDIFS